MGSISEFFSQEDKELIVSEIKKAEAKTSGEIRVRIEKSAGEDPLKAARTAFKMLGMKKTKLRNGVLIFLGIEDRRFVILGDNNINKKVPEGFWDSTRDIMQEHFREADFVKGLSEGIVRAGEQLATFFPCENKDVNEITNAISFEDEGENKI
ncbi:MAG: TPM domain-containing protein [Methanococcaceae archaeon]